MPTTAEMTRLLELAAAATPLPWEDGGIDGDYGPAIRQPGRGTLLTRTLPVDDAASYVADSRDDPAEPKRPEPDAVAELLVALRRRIEGIEKLAAVGTGPASYPELARLLILAADTIAHFNALCPLDCDQEMHFGRAADGEPDVADRDYVLAAANLAPAMARELLACRAQALARPDVPAFHAAVDRQMDACRDGLSAHARLVRDRAAALCGFIAGTTVHQPPSPRCLAALADYANQLAHAVGLPIRLTYDPAAGELRHNLGEEIPIPEPPTPSPEDTPCPADSATC